MKLLVISLLIMALWGCTAQKKMLHVSPPVNADVEWKGCIETKPAENAAGKDEFVVKGAIIKASEKIVFDNETVTLIDANITGRKIRFTSKVNTIIIGGAVTISCNRIQFDWKEKPGIKIKRDAADTANKLPVEFTLRYKNRTFWLRRGRITQLTGDRLEVSVIKQ